MFNEKDAVIGAPLGALALRSEMQAGTMRQVRKIKAGDTEIAIKRGQDGIWVFLTRGELGGFALRAVYSPGSRPVVEEIASTDNGYELRVRSATGLYRVRLSIPDKTQSLLRCTVALTPEADLLTPFWPRDLYTIDQDGDPLTTEGKVYAGQRGVNGGMLFFTMMKPCCGSLFYFQNLTALNPYFNATETKPDGIVGGQWPELGCQLPTSPDPNKPPTKPLLAGQEYTLSDVFLNYSAEVPEDQQQCARLFLDLLADVYARIERPATEYHNWVQKAEDTLHDLAHSPKATIQHYGHKYIHPYTAGEYPDSMVQLTVMTPIQEYANWTRKAIPLFDELRAGFDRFYDPELKTVRRYLPNVGEDKDKDAVDSWYLYHPLTNLARLAKEGDAEARELFLNSLDYGIRVAHHFKYNWPVMFNVQTWEVIQATRKEEEPGQSDAGGLYAHIMLQAWQLTKETRYLCEAEKAIRATEGRDFNLAYQTNLTAWGVNACIQLWRILGDEFYRDQSYVFLASFFHNCVIWESQLKAAQHYSTFLGATCLHDAPYMAIYECFESYCSFYEYVTQGQEDLPDSVRLLVTEYIKYTLTRAWYYYPKELPEEILSEEVRNTHIDRDLAFPLEDLYPDGQPAGQVGQEIYGCGAAFALVARAYHRFENVPFFLYSEYPISDVKDEEERHLTLEVRGVEGMTCRMRLIPERKKQLPALQIYVQEAYGAPNRPLNGSLTSEGDCEFTVPAGRRLVIHWEE